ncbi:MAG: PH domain-containing protein [Bacteroides sp.]
MNRVFPARIDGLYYLLLLMLSVNAIYALWGKLIILAVIWMLLLIVVIERIIHTAYTVTSDGHLIFFQGRFIRKKTVPLKDITSIKIHYTMKMGRFCLLHYVLIEYGNGKFITALPVKEREFVELIESRITQKN